MPELPNKLLEAIRTNKCVLFAGAGLSRGSIQENGEEKDLPTWDGLLVELLNRDRSLDYVSANEAGKLRKAVKV